MKLSDHNSFVTKYNIKLLQSGENLSQKNLTYISINILARKKKGITTTPYKWKSSYILFSTMCQKKYKVQIIENNNTIIIYIIYLNINRVPTIHYENRF